jgi:puromycin-sensitive aminopeptidase
VQRTLDGERGALESNLLDVAVAAVARAGEQPLFEALLARFPDEQEPSTKRRYMLALTAFESKGLTERAQELFFEGKVPMQDSASFVAGLLGNRAGQEGFWKKLRECWDLALERTGNAPMLMRRMVEAMGQLKERRQLDEARSFLESHPLEEAKQAIVQTLERLEQDVALFERTHGAVEAWTQEQR